MSSSSSSEQSSSSRDLVSLGCQPFSTAPLVSTTSSHHLFVEYSNDGSEKKLSKQEEQLLKSVDIKDLSPLMKRFREEKALTIKASQILDKVSSSFYKSLIFWISLIFLHN